MIADCINYSVVMNAHPHRRSAAFTALNLEQNLLTSAKRRDNWRNDPRIGFENQLNNDYYRNNEWDRGHIVRRANAALGDSQQQAQRASNETFYYSNSCLQHANLNQDEWLALEDWVKALDLVIKPGELRVIGPVLPLQLANKGDVIIPLDNNGSRIDWVNYTKRMVEEGIPVLSVSPRDTLV